MPILKLKQDDEGQEAAFELKWQMSLSCDERIRMMEKDSRRILLTLIENGQKKPFEIIKRKEESTNVTFFISFACTELVEVFYASGSTDSPSMVKFMIMIKLSR